MRKQLPALIAATLLLVGGAVAILHFYSRPVELTVAVPAIGDDTRLMQAAAHVFARQHKSIRLHLAPVPDWAAAATQLDSGDADLAVLRGDAALQSSAQTLLILHRNPMLVVAPAGSKIRRIADLRGKKLGIVHQLPQSQSIEHLVETVLRHYDIPHEAVTLVPLPPEETGVAVAAKKVDAIFSATGPLDGGAADIVAAVMGPARKPPIFIPIDEAGSIAKRDPALESSEIPHGAFGGDPPRPPETIETVGVDVLLMASPAMRDDIAAEVTRVFLTARGAIAGVAPLANSIEAPSTDRGGPIPVHQGAVDYLDGNEKSFFEKYSDGFYIGAMLLSLLGSAAATVASRAKDPREDAERLTEKLLTILEGAREASSCNELDANERELDNVVAQMLADPKLRRLDASAMHLVQLAMIQTRRTLEERRAALAREEREEKDEKIVDFRGARNSPPGA
ncbi:MAG TPA: TAXI family TRAP transporter solute-binding subunit [Methylocystis sp.]|nr:TAXI family TRAP transporter solute-binding subunit [Methylocystis sp.]